MHHAGINGTYVPFMVAPDRIGEAMASLRTLHIAGANITIPFKEAVIPFLDSVSESAEIIGAINTIARNGDKLKGYNTNAIGLMDALEEIGCAPAGKTAMILGAGGAAKASAFVLKWLKADQIFVVSKNAARARQVATPIEEVLNHDIPIQILINAGTISTRAESPEIRISWKNSTCPTANFLDLNYEEVLNHDHSGSRSLEDRNAVTSYTISTSRPESDAGNRGAGIRWSETKSDISHIQKSPIKVSVLYPAFLQKIPADLPHCELVLDLN